MLYLRIEQHTDVADGLLFYDNYIAFKSKEAAIKDAEEIMEALENDGYKVKQYLPKSTNDWFVWSATLKGIDEEYNKNDQVFIEVRKIYSF